MNIRLSGRAHSHTIVSRVMFTGLALPTGWNSLEIRAAGAEVVTSRTHYDGSGVLGDQRPEKYDVGLRGHVALQIHWSDQLRVRFKDVVILPAAPVHGLSSPAARSWEEQACQGGSTPNPCGFRSDNLPSVAGHTDIISRPDQLHRFCSFFP